MNTSNITNYKPKDFAELLGVSVKTLQIQRMMIDKLLFMQEFLQEIKRMIYRIKYHFYVNSVMPEE